MATLEKVRADIQSLSRDERELLIAEFTAIPDAEVGEIESTLQSRMDGPFITIDDPEAHFAERRQFFADRYRENTDG